MMLRRMPKCGWQNGVGGRVHWARQNRFVMIAPIPIVLADLLTLPGRSNAEAEQLLDALAKTDEAWEA